MGEGGEPLHRGVRTAELPSFPTEELARPTAEGRLEIESSFPRGAIVLLASALPPGMCAEHKEEENGPDQRHRNLSELRNLRHLYFIGGRASLAPRGLRSPQTALLPGRCHRTRGFRKERAIRPPSTLHVRDGFWAASDRPSIDETRRRA